MSNRAPVHEFYEADPDAYWALSKDRDFDAQIEVAIRLLGEQPRSAVDMFAGPGYHASILRQRFPTAEVIAIDASPAMRGVAERREGLQPGSYAIHVLGDGSPLPTSSPLCLALVLRYSIGYLDDEQLVPFLRSVHTALRPGGIVLFELHSIPLIANGFANLGIKRRTVDIDGRRVTCDWPDGPMNWLADSWTVLMPLTVSSASSTSVPTSSCYVSRERVYSERDLLTAARDAGDFDQVEIPELYQAAFPDGRLVCLRRSHV